MRNDSQSLHRVSLVRAQLMQISEAGGESFAAATLAVVKRFRYAPRFENGVAVPVDNVKTRISFKLAK